MNLFSVQSMHNEIYSCVVFINTYITPFEVIDEIISELEKVCNNNDKILFDLLLYRGNGSKRYFEAIYNSKSFEKGSFKPTYISKKSDIRKATTHYFKDNINLLEYSMLTKPQRQLISNGVVI